MVIRHPFMEWDDPCLDGKADSEAEEYEGSQWRGQSSQSFKIQCACMVVDEGKREYQEYCAYLGHDKIEDSGFLRFFFVIVKNDQKKGRDRHQFPKEKEGNQVMGSNNQRHGQNEKGSQRDKQVPFFPAFKMLGI